MPGRQGGLSEPGPYPGAPQDEDGLTSHTATAAKCLLFPSGVEEAGLSLLPKAKRLQGLGTQAGTCQGN